MHGAIPHEHENPFAAPGGVVRSQQDTVTNRLVTFQRSVLICIAVYLVAVVLQFLLPAWRDRLIWFVWADMLLAIVAVMGLSIEVYGLRWGTLLGLLSLLPLFGLFLLVVTHRKASVLVRKRLDTQTPHPHCSSRVLPGSADHAS